jgi:CRP-like cAMP-binding protein
MAGETIAHFGLVLSGSLHTVYEDYWGRQSILEKIVPGGLFGAAFVFSGSGQLPISVQAAEDSEILWIPGKKLAAACASACVFHIRIIENMLAMLAKNNVALVNKLNHFSRRNTRDKLLSYLSAQAFSAGSATFTIPFNRQELAGYLFVERSAMSAELSRMQKDGLLEYHKNTFTLKKEIEG